MKLNGHVINKDLNQYHHSGTLFQTSKGFFGQVIRAYDFNKIDSHRYQKKIFFSNLRLSNFLIFSIFLYNCS